MSELYAGFYKENITPQMGNIPLGGYGAISRRIAARVLHPLEALATALSQDDLTLLFITLDLINITDLLLSRWRKVISDATGIPEGQIILSGTHTHSGPAGQETGNIDAYYEQVDSQLPEIALRALENRKPCTLSYGNIEVGSPNLRLNFVRHYTMTDIEFKDHPEDGPVYYAGDNSGYKYVKDLEHYCYTGHVWEADPMLQILRFERKNADDILWVNFQAHATSSGGFSRFDMSSDFPYTTRKALEEMVPGAKAVYCQGAAGNLNPKTRLASEGVAGLTHYKTDEIPDTDGYGRALATYAFRALKTLTPCESDTLKFEKISLTMECDHRNDALLEKAREVADVFAKEGRSDHVYEMCEERNFNSPYHANGIIKRFNLPKDKTVELNAIRLGDVGMFTAPFELFDRTGVYIKEHSPFRQTLVQCYSCGSNSYLPCEGAPEDCYERNVTSFVPGSAEILRERVLSALKNLS